MAICLILVTDSVVSPSSGYENTLPPKTCIVSGPEEIQGFLVIIWSLTLILVGFSVVYDQKKLESYQEDVFVEIDSRVFDLFKEKASFAMHIILSS